MPLLRRQPFHREKAPPDLHPDEEVFFCKLTNEVFRDYEKFFERIILCNSLVWSCSVTGRSGLTYQEAEEMEEKALKQLAAFPVYLQKPILYLASLTQRSRVADVNDDIFPFVKDRYFIGEMVDVIIGAGKKTCKVLNVIGPSSSVPSSPTVNGEGPGDMPKKTPDKKKAFKPDLYQYVIQETGKPTSSVVKYRMVSRKKGFFTRDKTKLFLKQNCDSIDGVFRVKDSKWRKLHLQNARYEDFFPGAPPKFDFSEIKVKKAPAVKKVEKETKEPSPAPVSKKDFKKPSPGPQLTIEELKALREKEREEKLAQKVKEREEMKRKFEEEKERRKKEKALEIEKKREERRIQAELWREWSRVRDDLDCDDLAVLPEPKPVKSRIPLEYFGDAIMIVEFVNCFNSLFDLKASFPKGFTLSTMEEALLETDAGGLLADLLLMMITAIFSLQEEEEEEEAELTKQEKSSESMVEKVSGSDMSYNQLIEAATSMSQLPQLTQGCTLRKLPLDNFTMTEVLRLHILASGAQGSQGDAKFRYQQRGGYMPIDDAGLDFKRREQGIVKRLGVDNIYDFTPVEKLKLLKVLVDQFLTYAATRDLIEDNCDRVRQLKVDLRHLQWQEQKREKDEATTRYRNRMEEKQKERALMEMKRIFKVQQREEEIKKEEAARNGTVNVQEPMDISAQHMKITVDEIAALEASLPTAEEREDIQQKEDDAEADFKAEYSSKEREFLDNIMALQHGNAVYPIGRDRLYRRYWMFKSLQGLFVEDDELYVSEKALKPCLQNPEGSQYDLNNPMAIPPKLNVNVKLPVESKVQSESKDGSDKENESMNASNLNESAADVTNSSLTVTSANTTLNTSAVQSTNSGTVPVGGTKGTPGLNGSVDDSIVISDDEDDKPPTLECEMKIEPEPWVITPAISQLTNRTKCMWAFFRTEEEIEQLILSLNGRGMRESALKQALLEQKNKVISTAAAIPLDLMESDDEEMEDALTSPKVRTKEWRRGRRNVTGTVKNDSAHEGLELNLREMVLDLEERIHVGTLGHLRLKDRSAWRDAIENGGYISQSADPVFSKEKAPECNGILGDGEEAMDTSIEEMASNIAIAKDMAKALVQISRGIEPKYLQPPLGDNDKTKAKQKSDAAKKEEQKKSKTKDKDDSDAENNDDEAEVRQSQKNLMERWEESCLQSTSLAQVFLHLSTLEKSVTWSKSILHTRCRICRRKCDPDKILLCDQCDRGHHMYCLKPPLKSIPKTDWFCPDCKPKETKRSPRKERRRTFSERPSDDEEEEEEEEEEEMESDGMVGDEASSDEEISSLCAVCSKSGTLVCCDNCPLSYHLTCAKPALKKVPKGKWMCQICTGTDQKSGKIKMNLLGKGGKKGKKNVSPKSTSSSKQSSKRNSPRDSPVTVGGAKKRRQTESPLVEAVSQKLKKSSKSTSKLTQETKSDEVKHYTSSSRGNSKVQQLKMLEDVVMGMMEEADAWPFVRPVAKKDAPDYYDLIKTPMDFQTMKNRINKFMYTEPADLIKDVRLIFSNCVEYNKRTTSEFKCGSNMSKLFEKRLKNLEESAANNGPNSKRARTK